MMLCTPFQFQSPCSIMVVGPSSCGKTVFVEKLMRERSRLFTRPYNPVVYCYGANQPTTFERMKKEQGIHFHEGIPDTQLLGKWYKKSKGGILVLDDLMREGSDDHRGGGGRRAAGGGDDRKRATERSTHIKDSDTLTTSKIEMDRIRRKRF